MSKPQQFALNFKPMKPRNVETPKGAVSELFDQVGGVKEVQVRLGIGKSQAYAYTDPEASEELSVARAAALTTPAAPAMAEYFASRAGGVFVALPGATGDCPMVLTADVVREHGEAVAVALETLNGKAITPAARTKARKEIDEAICALAALRGHFGEGEQ